MTAGTAALPVRYPLELRPAEDGPHDPGINIFGGRTGFAHIVDGDAAPFRGKAVSGLSGSGKPLGAGGFKEPEYRLFEAAHIWEE
jgi:hypothetical protein